MFWTFKWKASLYNSSSFSDSPNNGAEDENEYYRPSGCDDESEDGNSTGKNYGRGQCSIEDYLGPKIQQTGSKTWKPKPRMITTSSYEACDEILFA